MTTYIKNAEAVTNANTVTAIIATSGFLNIYGGSIPANADAAAATLLVALPFSATAFPTAADSTPGATATANAITTTAATGTGTATHARAVSSGGTVAFQCAVGISGTEIVLDSVSITTGQDVGISALTLFMPEND